MTKLERQPIIVVCALAFEAAQLRKAGMDSTCELHVCGPGAQGVQRWAQQRTPGCMDARRVILAGLAGGLCAAATVGSAMVIDHVRMSCGTMCSPTLTIAAPANAVLGSISSASSALCTAAQKRAWFTAHQTDLVDMESEAFAAAMSYADARWAIVRGVSDGPDDELPEEIIAWVDAQGRTRSGAVALAMLRKPSLAMHAQRLANRSKAAMAAVAEVLMGLATA